MNQADPKWDDLKTRLATSAGLLVVGVFFMWLGGAPFAVLAAIVTGVMIWELARMIAPERRSEALTLAMLTGASVLFARAMPGFVAFPTLLVPAFAGIALLRTNNRLFGVFAIAICCAGYGLTAFRDSHGVVWLFWLVFVVAATDIFGYFGGKMIGGKKFWPSISPKKTWAGIVSGWAAAAVVGVVFLAITTAGRDLIWISAVISFASQLGDIAESAVKRRMGVKDSSNLLPGHGGLFDRFDGLLGASLLMLIVAQLTPIPQVRF